MSGRFSLLKNRVMRLSNAGEKLEELYIIVSFFNPNIRINYKSVGFLRILLL